MLYKPCGFSGACENSVNFLIAVFYENHDAAQMSPLQYDLSFKDVPKIDTRQGYSSSPHQSIDPHDTDLALQPQFSAVPSCTCHALSASSLTIFLPFYMNTMDYCIGTNIYRFFSIFSIWVEAKMVISLEGTNLLNDRCRRLLSKIFGEWGSFLTSLKVEYERDHDINEYGSRAIDPDWRWRTSDPIS